MKIGKVIKWTSSFFRIPCVYEAAKAAHPERWNGREIRDWSLPDTVYLNPDKMNGQTETAIEETVVLQNLFAMKGSDKTRLCA